jgi:hypothetical protein
MIVIRRNESAVRNPGQLDRLKRAIEVSKDMPVNQQREMFRQFFAQLKVLFSVA